MQSTAYSHHGPEDKCIRDALSNREYQLLSLAALGLSDKQIALRLGINAGTVGTYWIRIRGKIGPHSRTELVARYLHEQAASATNSLRNQNNALLEQLEIHATNGLELRDRLTLFEQIIYSAPDAILVVDIDGCITMANEQAAIMFGYPSDVIAGMQIDKLIPERFRKTHSTHRAGYAQLPKRKTMGGHVSTVALRSDGVEFPIVATLSSMNLGNILLFTCFVRSASETTAGLRS